MKNLRLKAARAAKDLSQQALAEKVGVSRQTINAIEKEIIIPQSGCALRYARSWTKRWMKFSGKRKNVKVRIYFNWKAAKDRA